MELLTATSSAPATSVGALEVRNLEVFYNRLAQVLRGVSLVVPAGSAVALLGPNGAGKSTMLRAISGLLDVHDGDIRKGSVWFDDADITGLDASAIVRRGITQVPEGRQVFVDLTVEENLRTGGHTRRRSSADARDAVEGIYERFPSLARLRDAKAGYLSGGEQQMLAIGRALMAGPKLLILDEPSLGLAPKLVHQVAETIAAIKAEGTTVLLVEQNASMALSIADHGYVMENGRIVMDAPAAKLLADDDIAEFYLGFHGGGAVDYRAVKHYRRRKRWLS